MKFLIFKDKDIMNTKPHVIILGGGFAGLESTFYLRHILSDQVDLTLVSDNYYFLYKPNTIYIPFGEDPKQYKIPLKRPTERMKINLVQAKVKSISPESKKVDIDGGYLNYDYLIVATGAAMRPEEIPGLKEHALTLWTIEEMIRLRDSLQKVIEKSDSDGNQKILFLVPPNNKCSGSLYEIVMMMDTWLQHKKVRDRVEIIWTTMEESYIQAFGPRLNTVVTKKFEERGIYGHKGFVVTHVEPGIVHYQNNEKREYDLLISFPPYVAKENYANLPIDDRGFINVEPDSCRVKGCGKIFAVGDAADFPIKQAFLALLQADAAGNHIGAEIKGK